MTIVRCDKIENEGGKLCMFEQFAVVKLMPLMNDYTLERQQTNNNKKGAA